MGNASKKEMIYALIEDLETFCADHIFSDVLLDNIVTLLEETTDRLKWITLGERMDGTYLTEEQCMQLQKFENLCEDLGGISNYE